MNNFQFLKRISFLILGVLFVFQSCSIDSETHFNKDMSGNTVSYLDLTDYLSFVQSFGATDDDIEELTVLFSGNELPDSLQTEVDSLTKSMKEAGLKNFKMEGYDGKGVKISFDFDNLKKLEGSPLIGDMIGEINPESILPVEMFSIGPGGTNYSWDGKWLEFSPTGGSLDNLLKEMKNGEVSTDEFDSSLSMIRKFGSNISFKQKYTFSRKVKEVESPIQYIAGKKEVTFIYNLSDMMKLIADGEDESIKIRLK